MRWTVDDAFSPYADDYSYHFFAEPAGNLVYFEGDYEFLIRQRASDSDASTIIGEPLATSRSEESSTAATSDSAIQLSPPTSIPFESGTEEPVVFTTSPSNPASSTHSSTTSPSESDRGGDSPPSPNAIISAFVIPPVFLLLTCLGGVFLWSRNCYRQRKRHPTVEDRTDSSSASDLPPHAPAKVPEDLLDQELSGRSSVLRQASWKAFVGRLVRSKSTRSATDEMERQAHAENGGGISQPIYELPAEDVCKNRPTCSSPKSFRIDTMDEEILQQPVTAGESDLDEIGVARIVQMSHGSPVRSTTREI